MPPQVHRRGPRLRLHVHAEEDHRVPRVHEHRPAPHRQEGQVHLGTGHAVIEQQQCLLELVKRQREFIHSGRSVVFCSWRRKKQGFYSRSGCLRN